MSIVFWIAQKLLPPADFARRERAYFCGNGFRLFGRSWGIPS